MDEPRLRWRLGVKLGLAAAGVVVAVLAAATLAGFAQLRLARSAAVWQEVGRPLQTIVGRLQARQEQVATLLSPQAQVDSFALREAIRAAGRDVLSGLQLLERGPGDSRFGEVDAELALLTRELQELGRETDAAAGGAAAPEARQHAAAVGEHVGRLGRGVETLSDAGSDRLAGLLIVLAAALATAALVVGVPLLMGTAARAGGRARRLARAVDAMTFHIRDGDPPPLPEGPRTSDEIGYLAHTLGGLVESLRNSVLQAQQLASELEEAAAHDALTGAMSRHRFQQSLDAELLRSRRYKGPLTLVIFNVDSLTSLNEKHGTEQGDYVLATIAELVRFNVRKTDYFVRWSGGEFVLLLTETGIDGGRHLAEKLRRNIEIHPFDRVGSVTVSVGLTQLVEGDTRDSFVDRADEALRRAKARGRNRVVAAAGQATEGTAGAKHPLVASADVGDLGQRRKVKGLRRTDLARAEARLGLPHEGGHAPQELVRPAWRPQGSGVACLRQEAAEGRDRRLLHGPHTLDHRQTGRSIFAKKRLRFVETLCGRVPGAALGLTLEAAVRCSQPLEGEALAVGQAGAVGQGLSCRRRSRCCGRCRARGCGSLGRAPVLAGALQGRSGIGDPSLQRGHPRAVVAAALAARSLEEVPLRGEVPEAAQRRLDFAVPLGELGGRLLAQRRDQLSLGPDHAPRRCHDLPLFGAETPEQGRETCRDRHGSRDVGQHREQAAALLGRERERLAVGLDSGSEGLDLREDLGPLVRADGDRDARLFLELQGSPVEAAGRRAAGQGADALHGASLRPLPAFHKQPDGPIRQGAGRRRSIRLTTPCEGCTMAAVRIRSKIVLIFLPLLITPLVLTTAAASLAARNGITGVATGLLRFKAEQLESYARGQWSLLTANNLQGNPRFVDAVRDGVAAFAAGLVRSPSELILAVDGAGRVAMASSAVELSASEAQELAILAEMQARGWRSARLGATDRVIQTFYFEPLQWLVAVSEESNVFYGAVTRIYSQSVVIAAVSLAATLVLIVLFSHYLTNPLREVAAAMRDIITSSDLSLRVAIRYQDETGELANTFNIMTAELERAYSQIKGYALRASVAERSERKLRNVFQIYVPRDVIDQHISNPEALLRGDNPVVAILFSDVRGFTSISEKLNPDVLVEMLNRYFTAWVDAVMAEGGIVDKYMGDGIMAFYGAPAKHSDDPARALKSAFNMLDSLVEFNAWQKENSRPEFRVGIGINYGVTTVGNIGHREKKLDYTIIGDQVNLASRLEGLTKQYRQPIIIFESMYRYVGREFPCRIVDRVAVKGRSMGVTIYAPRRSLTAEEERGWEMHHAALQCYYNREFEEASRRFEAVERILPGDQVSRIFRQRAGNFAQSPPPQHWNGVTEMLEK